MRTPTPPPAPPPQDAPRRTDDRTAAPGRRVARTAERGDTMTAALWLAIAVIALGSFAIGVLLGLGLGQYALARQGLLLADVVRDGTVAQYSAMRDGRDANRMDPERYAEGGER